MLQQERQLIQDLFDRLRSAERQTRDPDVEHLIANELRRVPNAPYSMAQTIIAQNKALESAAARIEALEGRSRQFEDEDSPASGAMGSPQAGQFGRRSGSVPAFAGRQGMMQGGGGFLAQAGQVALGVAGGMLMADAARSLLGSGSEAQAATGETAAAAASDTATPDTTDNALGESAGLNEVGGAESAGAEGGGGGMFGWLFGGGSQDAGAGGHDAGTGNAWDSGGDAGGGWDDGGGDSGGE